MSKRLGHKLGYSLGRGLSYGSAGSRNWTAPFKSDLLAGGDFTIITIGADKYFKDFISGKNLLITGYDFDSTILKGFPYKSAATISAPAGDAAFIAVDLNNFWYDSGGNPNQIPVISLFQDIDYEHKFFFNHAPQVVDGNGVETYEPRIIGWYVYNTVKSGADLTACNTAFSVPAIDTNAKWIDPINGVDATGNGTQALPYKTHSKVNGLTLTEGILVYCQSGTFAPFAWNKNYQLKGIGLTKILNVSGSRGIDYDPAGTVAQTIEGYIIDMAGVVGSNGWNGALLHDLTFNRIRSINGVGSFQSTALNNTNQLRVKNSYAAPNTAGVDKGLYINCKSIIENANIFTDGRAIYKDNAGKVNIDILNSKISALYIIRAYSEVALNCVGSSFKYSFAFYEFNAGSIGTLKFTSCKFETLADIVMFDYSNPRYSSVEYYNCVFTGFSDTTIGLTNIPAVRFDGNILKNGGLGKGLKVFVSHTANIAASTFTIDNNIITTDELGGAVAVGNETGLYYNKITGTINKNRFVSTDPNAHGVMVFNQNGGISEKWNHITGGITGFKSAAGDSYALCETSYNVMINSGLIGKGTPDINFVQNTIVWNQDNPNIGVLCNLNNTDADTDGCIVKNNIFIQLAVVDQIMIKNDMAGNFIDYNIYYCPNGSMTFQYAGASKTWAQWQALGFDTHSIVLTDAQYLGLFTDPDNGDFSLKAGSIAEGFCPKIAGFTVGLDSSTNWGSDTQLPSVVTKDNTADMVDCGAYVH